MTTTKTDRIQESLRAMPIGSTGTRFGVVVTRWAADLFEVETWGRSAGVTAARAAETVLARI